MIPLLDIIQQIFEEINFDICESLSFSNLEMKTSTKGSYNISTKECSTSLNINEWKFSILTCRK